jgi:hypothetical protein
VDSESRRLVDDQEPLVLVQHLLEECGCGASRGCGAGLAQTHRRNPDLVARLEAIIGAYPPAIDAHLAAPQKPVNAPPRHAGQFPVQEVVNALPVTVRIDADLSDPGGAAAGLLHRLFLHDQ